jgi:hypothetical protein
MLEEPLGGVVPAEHAAPSASQEVELVVIDPTAVAKGFSASQLTGEPVINGHREPMGTIDDLVITRVAEDSEGDFLRLGGHGVAVPFTSLELDGRNDRIVLAGATRDALKKLPVYQGAS